jgi:hypothetical protein
MKERAMMFESVMVNVNDNDNEWVALPTKERQAVKAEEK